MKPAPLIARASDALRLTPLTVPQLRRMLACSDRAARNALEELSSRRQVTVTGNTRGRMGAPARVWRIA